ncbi:MAG: hypothetical protein SNH63_05640 [Rikenellaceae bacterium]
MNREIVSFETAISQIAQQMGYNPQVMMEGSKSLRFAHPPAAMIYNSTLIDKVGRERCRLTTKIQVVLVKDGVSRSEGEKIEMMALMKCDALDIINGLSEYGNVVDVTDVEVEMDGDFMAQSDDVGVCVEATVVSNYNVFCEELQVM